MFYTDQMSTSKSSENCRNSPLSHLGYLEKFSIRIVKLNFLLAITVVPRESEKSASHNFSFLFLFFLLLSGRGGLNKVNHRSNAKVVNC